jgi:Tfp pilus assembly protein PilN
MIEINLIEKKKGFKAPVIIGIDFAKLPYVRIGFMAILYYFGVPEIVSRWEEERAIFNERANKIQKELKAVENDLAKYKNIKSQLMAFNKQIEKLKLRSKQVDQIIQEKTNPKLLLEKIARSVPEDVWFDTMKISSKKEIEITGGSESYTSIGQFIVEANESPYFGKSLQLADTKTAMEKVQGVEVRIETFKINGRIDIFDPFVK